MEAGKVKAMSYRERQNTCVAAVFITGLFLIGGGYFLLRGAWLPENAGPWFGFALLTLLIVLWRILLAFPEKPGELPAVFFPGLANRMTIFRGLIICFLAGFWPSDPPEGRPAWIPGLLFAVAMIMDALDGRLARLRCETSSFGAFLDRDLDALGTLIGVLIAIRYARLPAWYILAGMAYYLFACGEWLRKRRGLPLHPLPPSIYRRVVSVFQSVWIALALLPVEFLPMSGAWAALVMIPVLAGFLRDWRTVSGHTQPVPRL